MDMQKFFGNGSRVKKSISATSEAQCITCSFISLLFFTWSQWCTGSGFWSPIRPVINNFLDLDWISFPFQPDSEPDYPNEKNCGHAKNLIWNNRCIRQNYGISKSY